MCIYVCVRVKEDWLFNFLSVLSFFDELLLTRTLTCTCFTGLSFQVEHS
jgi:hypothetical protein